MARFDVIVIGIGGMGSAACLHLSRRGSRVLGLEQYGLAHDRGSSHGETRIFRRAYIGSPELTPLLHRSYALWDELEREARQPLLRRTGLLYAAVGQSSQIPAHAARVAAERGIDIEMLDAGTAERFPELRIPRGARAFFEPDAGYVAPEAAVEACCRLAEAHGADLRFHEEVRSFEQRGRAVLVTTSRGEYQADALVVTAGPWTGRLLADLGMPLVVQRIPQLWFPAGSARGAADGAPCFCFEMPYGFFYGVPAVKDGRMKICGGGRREPVEDPSRLHRALTPADLVDVRRFIAECVPGVPDEPAAASMCMCTMTPDERFVIDRHPAHERITFAAGFSGQGFKLCPAVGELLADLATRANAAPPEPFRLRWGTQRRASHSIQPTDR